VTGRTILVNAFIALYLFVAWSWGQPSDSWLGRAVAPFSKLVLWLGLGQTWGMFAPDPAMVEGHLVAVITTAGGGRIEWAPPRMADLSYREAFRKFRYQKYEASVLDGDTDYLRPALAEYLMRLHAERTPVRVDLVYHDHDVPGPEDEAQDEPERRELVFYSYPEP
jgi:hypothetical protein